MKKKVRMTCVLKSGQKITETVKVHRRDTSRLLKAIEAMREDIESYMSNETVTKGVATFGKTTIQFSEVAAISFKEN